MNFIASGAVNLGQNYVTQIQQNEKVSQIYFFFVKVFVQIEKKKITVSYIIQEFQ
jgi:hypothetical protein